MKNHNKLKYDYEKRHYANHQFVAGIDEAGRGAIAGPIVVAVVVLPKDYHSPLIQDSKSLSTKQRQKAYEIIIKTALVYDIEIIEPEIVEKLNPKQATIVGMELVLAKIINKIPITICLIDYEKPQFHFYGGLCESLVKGDQKALNIAAASIIAKVTRDNIMNRYHLLYPHYYLNQNKGYYTKKHQLALANYGILSIHRRTYAPVKRLQNSFLVLNNIKT